MQSRLLICNQFCMQSNSAIARVCDYHDNVADCVCVCVCVRACVCVCVCACTVCEMGSFVHKT